jgi:hypothetical protein
VLFLDGRYLFNVSNPKIFDELGYSEPAISAFSIGIGYKFGLGWKKIKS